jgi:hypothetical protein
MKDTLNIVQFNCGNSNHKASRPLFDGLDPAKHAVIIIQKPYYREALQNTYCLRNYILSYEANPHTKACFLVSNQIDAGNWSRK